MAGEAPFPARDRLFQKDCDNLSQGVNLCFCSARLQKCRKLTQRQQRLQLLAIGQPPADSPADAAPYFSQKACRFPGDRCSGEQLGAPVGQPPRQRVAAQMRLRQEPQIPRHIQRFTDDKRILP